MKAGETRSQFRIPELLYRWLREQAEKESRSINKQLAVELEARRQAKETEAQPA